VDVTIRSYGDVRERLDATVVRSVDPGTTVGELVDALDAEVDGSLVGDHPRAALLVLRNGTNVDHLDGFDTVLADGDVVGLSGSAMPE